MKSLNRNKKLCPFIVSAYDDCYCTEINSQKVESIVFYCMSNYVECEIYKKLSEIETQFKKTKDRENASI